MTTIKEILTALDSQILQLRRLIEESQSAIEILSTLKEKKEMIVPIGGGVFVKTSFLDEALIDVGEGIVVPKGIDDIISRLDKRIERAEEEIKRLEAEKTKLIKELEKREQE